MSSLEGKLQRPFQASGRLEAQDSSSYKYLKLWIKCDKNILTHSWVCKEKKKETYQVPKTQREENQAMEEMVWQPWGCGGEYASWKWAQMVRCFKCYMFHLYKDWWPVQDGEWTLRPSHADGALRRLHASRRGTRKYFLAKGEDRGVWLNLGL